MSLDPPPKRSHLVRGRIQSGLPLTSGANPSCSADCQDHRPRAPKATFSDIAKYMILQCVFRVFRIFGGIKSAPVEKRNFPRGPFAAFFRPSLILDSKMSLSRPTLGPPGHILDHKMSSNTPQKGSASKGGHPKWTSLTSGANPSCSAD